MRTNLIFEQGLQESDVLCCMSGLEKSGDPVGSLHEEELSRQQSRL